METVPVSAPIAQKLLAETYHVRVVAPGTAMSEEDNKTHVASQSGPTGPAGPVNGVLSIVKNDMSEALGQACEKYLAIAPKGAKLKKVRTPFIDEALLPVGQDLGVIEKGILAPHASSILMSLLYAARPPAACLRLGQHG